MNNELNEQTSEYETKRLEERISKLTGGIAIIKVGAMTELELREKKLLIEDAICATRAAIKSGIIPGGGKVFYEISQYLSNIEDNNYPDSKELLIEALKAPIVQLVENAGLNYEDIIPNLNKTMWFDASTSEVVDFTKMNIIDPTSVSTTVITNAVSIAGVLTNFLLGLVAAIIYAILLSTVGVGGVAIQYVYLLLQYFMIVNSMLTLFNLLPIMPLDGFNFIATFLRPDNKFVKWNERRGMRTLFTIIIVCLFVEILVGIDFFSLYLNLIHDFIYIPIALLGV